MIIQKDVIYGKHLGAALLLDVGIPDGEGLFPSLIYVHGGCWIQGSKEDAVGLDLNFWASKGYVAINIDYRLVTCCPAPICYQDLWCSIRWVTYNSTSLKVDPQKIFLVGISAGGHLVSLAATAGQNIVPKTGGLEKVESKIKGVISISGAYNLKDLLWGNGWIIPGMDSLEIRQFFSPIFNMKSDSVPQLIIHSKNDTAIPIKQAYQMIERIQQVKAQGKSIIFEDIGHVIYTKDIFNEINDFIIRLL